MAGNPIVGGPNSPGFHEYEMMKAADKTDVFRKRKPDSKAEVRSRKKEWLIVVILVALIWVVVYFISRYGSKTDTSTPKGYTNDTALTLYNQLGKKESKVIKYLNSYGVAVTKADTISTDQSIYTMRSGILGAGQQAWLTFENGKLVSYREEAYSPEWPKGKSGLAATLSSSYRGLIRKFGDPFFAEPGTTTPEDLAANEGSYKFQWNAEDDAICTLIVYEDSDGFHASAEFTPAP